MKRAALLPALGIALASVLVAPGVAGADGHGHDHGGGYTCSGGDVPAGFYKSITITGVCYMPSGTIVDRGDLWIAPGALLDAVTPGDPASAPVLPATLHVWGDVNVGRGGVFAAGCSPAGGCTGVTQDTIGGDVHAWGAEAVLLQAVRVWGDVSIVGGGGGVAGAPGSGDCFNPSYAIPAPWSEDAALSNPTTGSPQYTDIEDSVIGGNVRIIGVQTCWLGSFRDVVFGSESWFGNSTSDPDGNEFGSNHILGNLACYGNDPYVQFGDSSAASSLVGGRASGGCSFSRMVSNGGTDEHVSVPGWKLRTYAGSYTGTVLKTVPFGTTASGDMLQAQVFDATLAGGGLTGTATYDPSKPLGSTGAVTVQTIHPDGSGFFYGIINCACSFWGHTGGVAIYVYGSQTSGGLETGRFLIASGGMAAGGLGNLVGWGFFTNAHQATGTVAVTEHLALG